ncbi:hypothetical protein ACLK1S_26105 [Escherichia coli]
MESILSNKGVMPLLALLPLVILTFLHPFDGEKLQIAAAKAMRVNQSIRAKAATSPFLTARITLLTTLMVITPMNR